MISLKISFVGFSKLNASPQAPILRHRQQTLDKMCTIPLGGCETHLDLFNNNIFNIHPWETNREAASSCGGGGGEQLQQVMFSRPR